MRSYAIGMSLILSACVSTQQAAVPEVENPWLKDMHDLSRTHLSLVSDFSDPNNLQNPARRAAIRDSLKEMARAATGIEKAKKMPSADPKLEFTAAMLAQMSRETYAAFEMNDIGRAHFLFSRVSALCVSCHTREDQGKRDYKIGYPAELSNLSALHKTEFFLANRQYASATREGFSLAKNPRSALSFSHAWVTTLQRLLGMIVRVNEDPKQGRELVQAMLDNPNMPFFLKPDAQQWLEDLKAWMIEKPSKKPDALSEAAKIIREAEHRGLRSQKSLVLNLRASAKLAPLLDHRGLRDYAQALYYAGEAASGLRSLNLGMLDEYYFENCIDSAPHTALAELCYGHLETTLREGNPMMDLNPDAAFAMTFKLDEYRRRSTTKSDPNRKWILPKSEDIDTGKDLSN